MQCGACNVEFGKKDKEEGEPISCSRCPKKYHGLCLKLTREDYKAVRLNNKYVCPSCKMTISKKPRNDDTPIRNSVQSNNRAQTQHSDLDANAGSSFLSTARALVEMPVPKEVLSTFTAALQQLEQVFNSMKRELADFTASLNYTSEDITHFRNDISDMKTQLKELDSYKAQVKDLKDEVSLLRQELAAKEQRNYLKDVEITGLTETRGENLQQVVSVVCTKLGVQLDSRDVDDVRRVGKRGEDSAAGAERPRPVVLTLARRAPRDQIIRAARVRRGLNTSGLGIQGNNRQVYINEHLTKDNRILFSKARSVKNQLKFKYAWTSNGSIFMRRTETSSVLHISSESILNKLVANAQDNQIRTLRATSGDYSETVIAAPQLTPRQSFQ